MTALPQGPVLKYVGAKWGIADWIIEHMPAHEGYIEPFFGSGAVLFQKRRSRVELVNDIDDRIVTFFRVLRDQPEELARVLALTPYSRSELLASRATDFDGVSDLERARRFAIECWQTRGGAHGGSWRVDLHGAANQSVARTFGAVADRVLPTANRLAGVAIECRPALEVLRLASRRERGDTAATLIYADPPYPLTTRSHRLYQHEMTEQDHLELLDALDRHRGPVLLSSYPSALYAERLIGWTSIECTVANQMNAPRTEVLWLNPVAAGGQMRLRLEVAK